MKLAITDSNDVDYVFQLYDNTIRTLLDKHAPPKIVRRRLRPESPWFDAECHQAKEEVRRHERVYYSRKKSVCYRIWRNAVVHYNQLLRQKQESYWNGRVRETGGNAKELWKTVSDLLVPRASPPDNFTAL